jgi:hypothetical protein
LGRTDALKRNERSAVIETLHHLGKGLALLSDAMGRGQAYVAKEERAATRHVSAQIVILGVGEAWDVAGHEERSHTARGRGFVARTREDQEGIGAIGESHRGFLAIQDVGFAFALGR